MVKLVSCWWEVGWEDIPCTTVDDQAGSDAAYLVIGRQSLSLSVLSRGQ